MKTIFLAAGLAILGSHGAGAASLPAAFTSVTIFGDSLSDKGRASKAIEDLTGFGYPQPEYYADPDTGYRQFSNGRVWAAQMTDLFEAAGRDAANYAYGGARAIEQETLPPFPFPQVDLVPDLPSQIDEFVDDVTDNRFTPGASALGILFIGANDLPQAVSDNGGDPDGLKAAAEAVAMAVGSGARTLAANGVGTIALLNIGDLGRAPIFNLYNTSAAADATAASRYYNDQLELEAQALRAIGLEVIEVDVASRLNQVLDDPGLIGLNDAVNPCGVPVSLGPLNLKLYNFLGCTPSPSNTDALFFDDLHLSKAAQNEIFRLTSATIAAATVPLPMSALLLASGLVAVAGLARRRGA